MKNILTIVAVLIISSHLLASCTVRKSDHTADHSEHDQDTVGRATEIIMLTKRDEQYANIAVDTVKVKTIAEYTTVLGTSALDERRISVVSSRVRGRMDKLFVTNPQQMVSKGQALYAIYSEELLTYANEFLNALQQQTQFSDLKEVMDRLVEAARRKLMLLGLTGDQITELENTRKASPLITFYSPVSGILVELPVSEGEYVEAGTPLFRIADLSTIWVETQMYAQELRWLHENPTITIEFEAWPGKTLAGVPVFDNPSIETGRKISLVRFLVANPQLQLKAGMMAYVSIRRHEKTTLVIPKSALVVGSMNTAWVRTGDGKYENRMVTLGIRNKQEVEIVSGLNEGELIVTSGSYLLNSALVLKKGAGMSGMEGMKM